MSARRRIYKVVFQNLGQIVELYARQVGQGGLFGFVEVEDLVFAAKSELVLDPSEEGLRREFGGAKRLYLPLHSVLRIEEVEREGQARVRSREESGALVTPFPIPVLAPDRGPRSR